MILNTRKFLFKTISSSVGNLVPLESLKQIPFELKRVYYIYGVPKNVTRGFHSHKLLEQILICVHGKVKIKLKTLTEEEVVVLDEPNIGLYIGSMVWREMFDFTSDAVLLVLASEYYTEDDYIRDYSTYIKKAAEFYNKKENN